MAGIPLFDLSAQIGGIRAEIEASFRAVLDRTDFVLGEEVARFEREFASYLGVRHVVSCASGTDALFLVLKAVGLRPGDRVVTVSHTFPATVEAILHAGGIPVLLDVDPDTELLDAACLRRYLETHRSEPNRGILAVHLRGNPCSMNDLRSLADERGLFLLEDASQAHGAVFRGRKVGSFGLASAFSFYPGKNLGAFGDGGAISLDDPELTETLRRLRNHGRLSKHDHERIGFNSRLDTVQAAALRIKLARLDDWNAGRRSVAARYDETLARIPGVRTPRATPGGEHVYHHYAVRLPDRDALARLLFKEGIATGIHYPSAVHQYRSFRERSVVPFPLPVTEEICRSTLSLPIFPELTADSVDRISERVLRHRRSVK